MRNNKAQDWFYLEPVLLVSKEERYLNIPMLVNSPLKSVPKSSCYCNQQRCKFKQGPSTRKVPAGPRTATQAPQEVQTRLTSLVLKIRR